MCLLCDDEKAYAAYMTYLDAMERQGKAADPDKAMDAVLDQLEAANKANHPISRATWRARPMPASGRARAVRSGVFRSASRICSRPRTCAPPRALKFSAIS